MKCRSGLFCKILLIIFLLIFVVIIVFILIIEKIIPSNPDNNSRIVECRIKNHQKITFNETNSQRTLRLKDFEKCLNSSWLLPIWRKLHCNAYYKTGGKMEDWCYGFNLP